MFYSLESAPKMLKLLAKQIGFLLLMAVMGIAAVVAIESGYLLAWEVRRTHLLAIPLLIDIALVFIALTAVMWFLRGFLFGRGRPWLAWFSIGCWVSVIGLVTANAMGHREALFAPMFAAGKSALSDRIAALGEEPFSEIELANLPSDDRYRVCTSIFLDETTFYETRRSGIPVAVSVPTGKEFTAKVFLGSACPEDMKAQFAQLQQLETQSSNSLEKVEIDPDASDLSQKIALATKMMSMAAQAALLTHPDAIAQLFAIHREFKDKHIESKIQSAKLHLRLFQNGQVKDHQWKELEGFGSDDGRKRFLDPQIWNASVGDVSDTWNYWTMDLKADGSSEIELHKVDCRKLDRFDIVFTIVAKDGTTVLKPFVDPFGIVEDARYAQNTFAYTANAKACASKSQQVKLAPEVANASLKS